MNESGVFAIIWFLLRLAGPIYCAIKADHLNRKPGIWALLGFLFPIIAMIWISTLPKQTLWTKE
jgi:hypothetical protein